MEKNPTGKSTTELQIPDEKTALEIETIFKKTLKSIGRHTILAYEMENDQIQLDTIQLNDTAMNPIISNRYTMQKEALNKKSEALLEEQVTSLEGITEIANKYKDLFSTGLNQVREEIEGAMIKYGEILSKDTLSQINKESTRLTTITNQQAEKLQTLTNDMATRTQQLDTKLDEIKVAMLLQAEDSTKLFTANNKCTQANTTLDNKLTIMQHKLDEMATQLNKRITTMRTLTETQTTAMEKISTVISNTIKDDKENFLRRLKELEDERRADKTLVETFKSEFKAIKQQVESLPPPPPPQNDTEASSPSPSQSETRPLSPLSDKELVNMKATITNLQLKCRELFQLTNALVKTGTTPITTTENLENLKANMSLRRLDDVEKNVVYLLSKVEVMEPRHKLDFAELRELLETKGILSNGQQIPALGDKRPHSIMARGADDEGKILRLEEEVKRVDFKLASLVEYIHQFRSNILNPSFPDKLDTGLQHIEEILKNHEMFIAYLVDPVAASNTPMDDESSHFALTVSALGRQHEDTPTISPALLTAISRLVADKTKKEREQQEQEAKKQKMKDQSSDKSIPDYMKKFVAQLMVDQVEPLKKKIIDLEQQLQQKSS